jgi:multidrug efflux pump subunit AcrA (membrane-fusion protein)
MMMNMSKNGLRSLYLILFTGLLAGNAGSLYAQVDRTELEKSQAPITFINYEGPHARIETRGQIRNIGFGQGLAVKSGTARPGSPNRYFVIHSVSPAEDGKLDADIFGLGVDTGVDHIRNLRLIIQGYLEGAYNYSSRDAALLAEYITIYNAVYRGDWDYFSGRYKTPVVQNLSREKAGLSIRFDEWPGQTLMLIPLGPGGLSSVDTTSLSDSRVVEELRREEDRGVDQRQDMVDLKEREAEAAEQRAEVQREAIREEEQRIARERAEVDRERSAIDEERRQAREDAARGEDTSQREQELDQREAEADRQAGELDQREEDLAAEREEAQRTEEFAEQKNAEAQQEREDIARDQQAIIAEEDGRVQAPQGLLGASIENLDTSLGRLLRLNPSTGGELKRSPLDTVNIRTLSFVGGKILAIAGENRGNGAIRLIEVDGNTLEMAKQGDDDIHPGSLLWVSGQDLFAITIHYDDGSLYLARFDVNLVKQAQSRITVHPNASASFQDNMVLTQRSDGSAAVLNAGDLTEALR